MSHDRDWGRLERLFDEGVELPAGEREAWLDRTCADDPALRERLRRMFAAHESPGFLDRPLAPASTEGFEARVARVLADRYVVEATLGVGGMSAVFRAHERKHERPVVLKVMQPTIAAAMGEGRFLDEVRIAARLSHPHILTLIDSGTVDGLFYYVMPYVEGESLRERLARDGARPLGEAVALLRDVADALAHAHASGVVHRDLKPDNVLCVGSHAFLIDFGVAKLESDVTRPHATEPGLPIGTPGYMAPEQAAGLPVDHRTDLYAWGLLAREMLTGRKRAQESPAASRESLRDLRPEIPRSLDSLIEACLAIDPAERPQSARSVVALLDGLVSARARRPRWPIAAAAAVILVALGIGLARRPPAVPAVGSVAGPVAVLPLFDETADSTLGGWGRLAGDWFTQGLHESGLLPVIPWPTMLLAADDHRATGGDPVAMVRRQTGAATVVSGTYYRTGDSLRFQASITDARTGRLLAAIPPVVVGRDSAAAGVRELRDRLMGAIAVAFDDRLLGASSVGTRPPTWEAYRLFDQGLTEFNQYRYGEAVTLMREAWARDTTFLPALLYAAMAAVNRSDVELADTIITMALDRRAALSQYHAALADFIRHYLDGDRGRALDPIMRANAMAPGSRAAYNAAYILLQLNRPAEADSMLRTMDPDHGPMRAWPSYWSQRAYSAHLLGRHEDELALAREMKRRFPDQRVAWVIESRALAALGRRAALDSTLASAAALPPDVYWSQGAMRMIAAEEYAVHRTGDSTAAYRDAVRWLEGRLAERPRDRNHRSWLGLAHVGLARYDEAERVFDALDREGPERIFHRGQLAVLAARRGNAPLAARRLGSAPGASHGEYAVYLARIAALTGRHDEALAKLAEGLRLGVYNWHWMHHDLQRDFAALHDDQRYRTLLAPPVVPRR